jgi:tetratricopeptide (TPR) repeat protein
MLDAGDAAIQPGSPTIPATLHDSLMARLDRLGPAKELAQIGSVLGREFTPAMLRAVLPDHPDIEGGLQRLCASSLAYRAEREDGAATIVFHHALVQDAAYDSLLRRRRREIHRAVAEAMLAGDPAFAGAEPEVVARHCTGGELRSEAVAHWLEAGLQAMDRAAAAPALTYLGAALEQLEQAPDHPERLATELRIQMALAPAAMAIHGWAAHAVEKICRRAIELAAASGDAQALCGGTWLLWTNFFIRGEMDPALETARRVAAMAEQSGTAFLALAAAHALSYTHYSRGEYASCIAAARAGLARLDPESDQQALRIFQLAPGEALPAIMANAYWLLGQRDEAAAAMARAQAAAEALQHPPALVHCLCVSSYWLLFSRQWDRLGPIAERAVRISVEEGYRFWEPMARMALAFADAEQGDRAAALRSALSNMERYKATGAGLVASQFEARLAELMIRAGDPAGALRRLDACIPDAEARAERCYMPELYRVRGTAHAALGDHAAALRDLHRAIALSSEQGAMPLLDRAKADLTSFRHWADSDSHSKADLT